MNLENAQAIKKIQKLPSVSHDLKLQIWEIYKDEFGQYPSGAITCGNCVSDSFWKLVTRADIFLAQPPKTIEITPTEASKQVDDYTKE